MRLVRRASVDPPSQQRAFLVGQRPLAAVRRRHDNIGIGVMDPRKQHALLGRTGHDGRAIGSDRRGRLERIEPKPRLLLRTIGTVALEAAITQDWADVPAVTNLARKSRRAGSCPSARCPRPAAGHQPRTAHGKHQGTQKQPWEESHAIHPSPETRTAKQGVSIADLHRRLVNRMVSPWTFSARRTAPDDWLCIPEP